jgi:hypothetical protein
MLSRRSLALWCGVATLALLTLLASTARPAAAQSDGEVGINFVAFACPNLEADLYGGCDILTGATFEILADGVPLADSPFTTGPTSLVPGFFFYAPATATLTITELSVDPPGNAPAPGFDPLIVNVADIPIGGCGGESTCPTIEFVNLPFAIADGPAGQPPVAEEVAVLPATGAGHAPVSSTQQLLPWLSLALGALCAGFVLSRRPAPLPSRIDG